MKIGMSVQTAIAANATNNNVVRDEQYQTIPFDGVLRLLATGSAAGLRHTLIISGTSILDAGFVNAQNRVPVTPDDEVITQVEVFQGQQVFLKVQNTTAGSLTYNALIEIEGYVE